MELRAATSRSRTGEYGASGVPSYSSHCVADCLQVQVRKGNAGLMLRWNPVRVQWDLSLWQKSLHSVVSQSFHLNTDPLVALLGSVPLR